MAFDPTTITDWTRSDAYHNRFLIPSDDALTSALNVSEQNGLPPYAVSEAQGKFLNLLAKSIQARRILEIGTLGGYDIYSFTLVLEILLIKFVCSDT
jgi:predicted O-methyltransferase YrrM